MRKNKCGQWYWFEPVFRNNIALVCCPAKEAAKRLRQVLPEDVCKECDPTLTDLACDGRFIGTRHETSGLFAVFWLKPTADVGVVAHEAFHAVYFFHREKGITLSESSEEVFTYMLEWLVRELLQRRNTLLAPADPEGR